MSSLKIGDEVLYLPDPIHALERDHHGDFSWVLGIRHFEAKIRNGRQELVEVIEEADDRQLKDYFDLLNRSPNAAEERKRLVLIRPKKAWKAVVTNVNKDGTCDLDITSGSRTGVTLHYHHVPVDELKKQPHSCHKLA